MTYSWNANSVSGVFLPHRSSMLHRPVCIPTAGTLAPIPLGPVHERRRRNVVGCICVTNLLPSARTDIFSASNDLAFSVDEAKLLVGRFQSGYADLNQSDLVSTRTRPPADSMYIAQSAERL